MFRGCFVSWQFLVYCNLHVIYNIFIFHFKWYASNVYGDFCIISQCTIRIFSFGTYHEWRSSKVKSDVKQLRRKIKSLTVCYIYILSSPYVKYLRRQLYLPQLCMFYIDVIIIIVVYFYPTLLNNRTKQMCSSS